MKKYIIKHKMILMLTIIATLLSAIADVYFAFVIKKVIDYGNEGMEVLIKWIIFALSFIFLTGVLSYLRNLFESMYTKHTIASLKSDVFSGIMHKKISKFMSKNSGSYMSSLSNDITIVEQDYFLNLLEIIDNVFIFFISSYSLLIINWKIALCVLVLGFVPLLFPVVFKKKMGQKKLKYSEANQELTKVTKDYFLGYEVIKSFHITERIENDYSKSNGRTEQAKFDYKIFQYLVDNLGAGSGQIMHLSAIAIGSYLVSKKIITFGDLVAILQLMSFVVNPIVLIATRLGKVNSTYEIRRQLMSYTSELSDDSLKFHDLSGDITMKDLSFSYGDVQVLKDISITFEACKKYAIVGSSGSGKSTLLKLLMNYYDDYQGNIVFNKTDLKYVSDHDLYKHLSVIHQNVFMFDDTLVNNITLYNEYSQFAIHKAMSKAAIESYSQNDLVGENGSKLSGGEKQRVSIARALIKECPLLLIDEATAALDANTSKEIDKVLLSLDDITVISVTHKLDSDVLMGYDEIIVMDNGRIISKGRFESLLNDCKVFKLLMERYQ